MANFDFNLRHYYFERFCLQVKKMAVYKNQRHRLRTQQQDQASALIDIQSSHYARRKLNFSLPSSHNDCI